MTHNKVFLMKFEVFGWMTKHCLECLICLTNQNKKLVVNGEVKPSKSTVVIFFVSA